MMENDMDYFKDGAIGALTADDINMLGTPMFGSTGGNMYYTGTTDPTGRFVETDINMAFNITKVDISKTIQYKYNESVYITEILEYINNTYGEHYSQNKFQATEFIIDSGHGTGFCMGNVMKYAQRYGKKGSPADWRKDLMKVIHYAIMQLHVHDKETK